MAARLARAPELLERAGEPVVRVVVRGRQVDQRAKLGLGLLVAAQPEVGDPERLADRRLRRLAALRLLERDRRLSGHAPLQMRAPLLEQVVGLALGHNPKIGKLRRPGASGPRAARAPPAERNRAPQPAPNGSQLRLRLAGSLGAGRRRAEARQPHVLDEPAGVDAGPFEHDLAHLGDPEVARDRDPDIEQIADELAPAGGCDRARIARQEPAAPEHELRGHEEQHERGETGDDDRRDREAPRGRASAARLATSPLDAPAAPPSRWPRLPSWKRSRLVVRPPRCSS